MRHVRGRVLITSLVGLALPVATGCQTGGALPALDAENARLAREGRLPGLAVDGEGVVSTPDLPFGVGLPEGGPGGVVVGVPGGAGDGTIVVDDGVTVDGDLEALAGVGAPFVASYAHADATAAQLYFQASAGSAFAQVSLDITGTDLLAAPAGEYRSASDGTGELTVLMSASANLDPTVPGFFSLTSDVSLRLSDEPDGARKLQAVGAFTLEDGSVRRELVSVTIREGSVRRIDSIEAIQSGDLGDILGFVGPTTRFDGTYSASGSSLRLDAEGADWWVMNYLYVNGVDLATAAAGTYRNAPETGVTISAVGCSGPSFGNYTYDHPSDDAEIELEDGPDGERSLHYSARFVGPDGLSSQVASATLRFRIRARRGR